MSNLLLRFLTAVVAIPLLILAIEWKNPLGVWLWVPEHAGKELNEISV